MDSNVWIRSMNLDNAAASEKIKPNLICFPYAGGSASYYFKWKELHEDFNLYAVQYPMRENRICDEMSENIQELAREIVLENTELFQAPFLLFGHSLGGIIAYETACAVRDILNEAPEVLYISGAMPPFKSDRVKKTSHLSKEQFLEVIKDYEGTPEELFLDPAFEEYYLPILRADFGLLERYQWKENKPLSCPIQCFGGNRDETASKTDCMKWSQMTQSYFDYFEFDGSHFFIDQHKSVIQHMIIENMDSQRR